MPHGLVAGERTPAIPFEITDLDAAPPGVLQGFVAQRLSDAILSGELVPGEKLSPTRIAAQLSVSPIPVREALAALETTGQVRRVPRIGFFVAELSVEEVNDVYHWRQVLEDEAHRMAMPLLGDADVERMRKLNHAWRRATTRRQRDPLAIARANRAFHFVAFEQAGSDVLLKFLDQLWNAATLYQNAIIATNYPYELVNEHHEMIVAAFEARDVQAANAAMALHRGATLDSIRAMTMERQQGSARPNWAAPRLGSGRAG